MNPQNRDGVGMPQDGIIRGEQVPVNPMERLEASAVSLMQHSVVLGIVLEVQLNSPATKEEALNRIRAAIIVSVF